MSLLGDLKIVDKSETDFPDETTEEFTPDPVPDERPATRRKAAAKPAAAKPATRKPAPRAKSPAAQARDVANDLAGVFELAAVLWTARDEVCGPALEAQARPIADALAAVFEGYPRLLAFFTLAENGTLLVKLLGLFAAVKPVVTAVRSHHGPAARAARDAGDEHPVSNPAADPDLYPAFTGVPRAYPA